MQKLVGKRVIAIFDEKKGIGEREYKGQIEKMEGSLVLLVSVKRVLDYDLDEKTNKYKEEDHPDLLINMHSAKFIRFAIIPESKA
ncbi:MAG: hypothetical protein WC663_00080 [Patescibacteria group bacterium]|jgi:hypothetical protein